MVLDYQTLDVLRRTHPAWRLLRADHGRLVAAFLQRVFVIPNRRMMSQADLAGALDDELFDLRERLATAFPKAATDYLNDWADPANAWLRKFYRQGSDEPYFDLTPSTEKAIIWLETLTERNFVGTESRLLTLFELLKQLTEGTETNPTARLAELKKRRADIDDEIARVASGDMPILDDTSIKDRFQQVTQLARGLLTDFREVEQNFRRLDRQAREQIALWQGSKGHLLEKIFGERDIIAESDQGRSFRAFWDFLMSSSRQEQFTTLLDRVLALAPVAELKPDPRLRRVHYDWLEAGELTQRTVAQLSQQLRRFLDDQAWLENRRIMDILHNIEASALSLRDRALPADIMAIADATATIELPMERPLYSPTTKPVILDIALAPEEADIDDAALYSQIVIDKADLERHIHAALQARTQINLPELCRIFPLQHGVAELVAYLQLATDDAKAVVDETVVDTIGWIRTTPDGQARAMQAKMPRVIYVA